MKSFFCARFTRGYSLRDKKQALSYNANARIMLTIIIIPLWRPIPGKGGDNIVITPEPLFAITRLLLFVSQIPDRQRSSQTRAWEHGHPGLSVNPDAIYVPETYRLPAFFF